MALICPSCGTENRSVAKFCIECISPLPVGFAATQIAAPPAAPRDEGPASLPSALAAFASAASSPPLPLGWGESPMLPLPPPAPAPSPWRWVVAALLLGGLLLAAGWWLGRWLDDAPGPVPVPPQATGRVVEPMPVTVTVPTQDAQAAQAGLGPGETLVPDQATARAPMQAVPTLVPDAGAKRAMPPPTPAGPAVRSVDASGMATVPAGVATLAAPPVRRAAAPTTLFAPCDGLNFVFASRCKVDLCEQPVHQRKAECAPVLAQQRRMDEKRNPLLAD